MTENFIDRGRVDTKFMAHFLTVTWERLFSAAEFIRSQLHCQPLPLYNFKKAGIKFE